MIFKRKPRMAVKKVSGVKKASPKTSGVSKKRSTSGISRAVPSGKKTPGIDISELFSMIRGKAYEFYLDRSGAHGDDQADWYRAEQEVRRMHKVK
ncbi:MAG: DUF2934 domain-containing protein [Candidatus Omnitrophica bacterium]|nr:DUF2934 domain-containing protein [Candidatus Omnitrophota bacterium]